MGTAPLAATLKVEAKQYKINSRKGIIMSYSMYLDDARIPENDFDVIVRSYEEAVEWVLNNGIPSFVSFDNDLGATSKGETLQTGYDFAKWLVQIALDEMLQFPPNFSFDIHCGDAVARNNIKAILNNYLHYNLIYN